MKIGNPFVTPSTRAFIAEARKTPGYSFFDLLHGYVYARWPYLYIGIGVGEHPLARWLAPLGGWINRLITKRKPEEHIHSHIGFADTYHGKAVPLATAKELVSIREDIHIPDLVQVIPYQRARSIIMKNPDHIVVLDCPCRSAREHPCLPLDVCLIVGDPFAGFIHEHHPDRSRRITSDEAVAILTAEDKRGHVHHAFFKDAMLDRFYAICNCCECCCGAMQAQRNGTPMLASSGYVSQVDDDLCIGCGDCNVFCQFHALEVVDGTNHVIYEKCIGCGICTSKCVQGALSLVQDDAKGVPLEICEVMRDGIFPKAAEMSHPPIVPMTCTNAMQASDTAPPPPTASSTNPFPCPKDDCHGAVSDGTFTECKVDVCEKCKEIKEGEAHVCDKDTLATVNLIVTSTKPCPKCATKIFKIYGCDQMFCTKCHTAFSWQTGDIETKYVHNPHYFEWRLTLTDADDIERNPEDIIERIAQVLSPYQHVYLWCNHYIIIFQRIIEESLFIAEGLRNCLNDKQIKLTRLGFRKEYLRSKRPDAKHRWQLKLLKQLNLLDLARDLAVVVDMVPQAFDEKFAERLPVNSWYKFHEKIETEIFDHMNTLFRTCCKRHRAKCLISLSTEEGFAISSAFGILF